MIALIISIQTSFYLIVRDFPILLLRIEMVSLFLSV